MGKTKHPIVYSLILYHIHLSLCSDIGSDTCGIHTHQLKFDFDCMDKHANATTHTHDNQVHQLNYTLTSLHRVKIIGYNWFELHWNDYDTFDILIKFKKYKSYKGTLEEDTMEELTNTLESICKLHTFGHVWNHYNPNGMQSHLTSKHAMTNDIVL